MYKKDDKYINMTKNLTKDNSEYFEEHFKEYEEIVETSIRIYSSDGFRGTIFSTGAVGIRQVDNKNVSNNPGSQG